MGFVLLLVAGLICWFFISAMNRAKTRMAYADQQQALREMLSLTTEPHLKPTWVTNRDRVDEFTHSTLRLSDRRGIPKSYSRQIFSEPQVAALLFHFSALLERKGNGFASQQIAAGEFVETMWLRLKPEQKQMFINVDMGHPPV